MSGGARKKFQITNFTMPNNFSSMEYSLKSIPGLADIGVPHGDGDGPIDLALRPESKIDLHHADQCEKLKGLHGSKAT